MKILITGVYGIVGSFIANNLINEHEIIGVGRKDSYEGCHKYYSCDITDEKSLEEIIKENQDLDFIIHCAALAHNKGNDLSYDRFIKVNFEATKSLVDLSNKYLKLKDFIFVSTISVYGEQLTKEIYSEDDICYPKSPYAVAKKMSEEYLLKEYKGKTSILRLNPVYSKEFLLNIERRTEIKGYLYKIGNGNQKLTLCNIKNIYEAVKYLINNYEKDGTEIYNIGDSEPYKYLDLIKEFSNKKAITIPKFLISWLYKINEVTLKKQFIHENSIKLISNNIYSTKKINNRVNLKYTIKDLE